MARALCDNESRNARARGEEAQDILCRAQLVTRGQQRTSASQGSPDFPLHWEGWEGYSHTWCTRVCQTAAKMERCLLEPFITQDAGSTVSSRSTEHSRIAVPPSRPQTSALLCR